MKITITETKEKTILEANGWFLFVFLDFKNHHDYIRSKLKLPRSLGGGKITDFYAPEYLVDSKQSYENINATIEKKIRHKKEKKKHE